MAIKDLVLVTGGTGYVATFTLYQLLQRGYTVRTTVRNVSRSSELNKDLINLNSIKHNQLSYFAADLTKDNGWEEAIKDCEYILHIASPISGGQATDEEMVTPAKVGTLRVLNLALKYGVKRVVIMSSCAAITYNELKPDPVTGAPPLLDESVFSSDKVIPNSYSRSKLVQERAVWDWLKAPANKDAANPVEVAVLNPPGIFGPNVPGKQSQAAVTVIGNLINGRSKTGLPRLYFGSCDVRDVAYLTYRAMIEPKAKNERFIVDSTDKPDLSMFELVQVIRKHYSITENNKDGKVNLNNLAARELPSWLVRVLSYVMPPLRLIVPYLDIKKHTTNAKAVKTFNWKPIQVDESVIATIDTM
ncbi:hypothetical protein DFJ63DRAFT_285795 [Scheffersomyces coipomensis]|uniref:uncharacterized protein n=1 Tax=Scheffersomyces coipomensis TaxID=1788519 RepID=UPI00315D06B9